MSQLQIFENPEFGDIRMVEIDGAPYAVGVDVARALGYAAPSKAVIDRCKGIAKAVIPSYNQHGAEVMQGTNVIPESDIYRLIFGSKLEGAKKFQAWIFEEVLPSIRKHGIYTREELLDNPELLLDVTQALVDERRKSKQLQAENAALETENTVMRPKARFADAVACAETDIPVGELAKILKGNGVDIGQTRLFEWMRVNGYLMQSRGADWNAPTQRATDLGLFRIKESAVTHPGGSVFVGKTPMVTGKGQQYFVNHFLGKV